MIADGIIKYMQTRAGPTSKELNEVADAEKFLSKSEYGVIGKIVRIYMYSLLYC